MLSQDLLDILVCPVCKKPLVLKKNALKKNALEENGESLKCTQCRRVYPVKDDIPIMLVDEAVVDPT